MVCISGAMMYVRRRSSTGRVYMTSNLSPCGLRREPANLNAPKRENPINGKSKPDT